MKQSVLLSLCFIVLLACNNEKQNIQPRLNFEIVKGVAQKGPFIVGTEITLSELDRKLNQTGKTFTASTSDNFGSFRFLNIQIENPIVLFTADGYYFNEISGEISSSRLVLNALVDLSEDTVMNINLLTHLGIDRIYTLVEEGLDFSEARNQAKNEIFSIFNFNENTNKKANEMDISEEGEENSILLAISSIIQSVNSTGEMSELISEIKLDIKGDGVLNDSSLQSELMNNATLLDYNQIRENLEERYQVEEMSIPDFENKVDYFVQNTDFGFNLEIEYPEDVQGLANLLTLPDNTVLDCFRFYGVAATVPENSDLKVVFTMLNRDYDDLMIHYFGGKETDWVISRSNAKVTFIPNLKGELLGRPIFWETEGPIIVDFYEHKSDTVSKSIQLVTQFKDDGNIVIPTDGDYGNNILSLADNSVIEANKTYSLAAEVPDYMWLEFYAFVKTMDGDIEFNLPDAQNEDVICQYLADKDGFYFNIRYEQGLGDVPISFSGKGKIEVKFYCNPYEEISYKTVYLNVQ